VTHVAGDVDDFSSHRLDRHVVVTSGSDMLVFGVRLGDGGHRQRAHGSDTDDDTEQGFHSEWISLESALGFHCC
jgi:hypothetical protein